jgi:hypothetical protein
VSELDVFLLFCKNFKALGKRFRSPIIVDGRANTGADAANILHRDGSFKLYDYRAGEAFDCFSFAMLMTGLDFSGVIKYLCNQFGLVNNGDVQMLPKRSLVNKNTIFENSKDYTIDVKYEPWRKESLEYWINHGWQPYMLDKARIRPIERFWMSNDDDYRQAYDRPSIGPISFSYDFIEIDDIFRRKIYNPLALHKSLKWKNNTNKSIIQALNTIDYHVDTLYITSSMKDCGPYWSIFNKPCAIAPNGESSLFTVEQIRMIRQISDHQILWYDNDVTGRYNARKQSELYGFDYMWNPIGSPKDQSDYWLKRGGNEFKKLIDEQNSRKAI